MKSQDNLYKDIISKMVDEQLELSELLIYLTDEYKISWEEAEGHVEVVMSAIERNIN